MEDHNKTVTEISTRLQDLYSRKERFRIFHGSTNSTRNYKVDKKNMIDTRSLNRVLSIDVATKTALVEPNVSMEELVEASLPYGLIPPVVMEFKGITVGGGFSGTGAESSSFRYGSFDTSIQGIEIVLADGEILNASRKHHQDLFAGATSTLGTLGVTTLLELRLVQAKRYVLTTYKRFDGLESTLQGLQDAREDPGNDYVDAILMAKDKGIVICGSLTDNITSSTRIQRFQRAQDPWFYMHAASTTTPDQTSISEAIPLKDYLFRYDRGAFWMGKYAFEYFKTPFNTLTRWVLDPFMQTSTMYHALHESGHMNQYIIQDICIPASSAPNFLNSIDKILGYYPLWLCPISAAQTPSFHPHALVSDQVLNIGIWCPSSASPSLAQTLNSSLETLVLQSGGRKWLYAQAFYSEQVFWDDIYAGEKEWYFGLRNKYRAGHLASVFDKAVGSAGGVSKGVNGEEAKSWKDWAKDWVWGVWPVSGVYGVAKTVFGREKEYLLV